jgi:hypothetical protein
MLFQGDFHDVLQVRPLVLRGASAAAAFSKMAHRLRALGPSVPIAEGAQEERVREIMAAVHTHYGGAVSPLFPHAAKNSASTFQWLKAAAVDPEAIAKLSRSWKKGLAALASLAVLAGRWPTAESKIALRRYGPRNRRDGRFLRMSIVRRLGFQTPQSIRGGHRVFDRTSGLEKPLDLTEWRPWAIPAGWSRCKVVF